jgi:hypothetical protein
MHTVIRVRLLWFVDALNGFPQIQQPWEMELERVRLTTPESDTEL